MFKLTPRQAEVLAFIRRCLEAQGYPPTRQEIAGTLGFRSANAAEEHLKALARKGAIQLVAGASRGIRLASPAAPAGLPVIGRVAAGAPILALPHVEEYCPADPALFQPRADFLLRVQGQSMQDAGILDGDLLAVHATPEARNGQIVVARLDNEVTVKRFRHEGRQVILQAENACFSPIQIDLDRQELVIEGLMVGIIRRQGKAGRP